MCMCLLRVIYSAKWFTCIMSCDDSMYVKWTLAPMSQKCDEPFKICNEE